MTAEGARGSELAELVAYHVLGYVDRDELVPVVHGESMAHEFGGDHRSAAPCLDNRLLAALLHRGDFLLKLYADERASYFS